MERTERFCLVAVAWALALSLAQRSKCVARPSDIHSGYITPAFCKPPLKASW